MAIASPISRRGVGNRTFAQTPSRRPGDAPSEADRRWESQRSIPRVGTDTTSGSERIIERRSKQLAERVGKSICTFGSVDVEHAYLILLSSNHPCPFHQL